MKKRVSILICLVMSLFLISGCAAKEEPVEYEKDVVDQTIEFVIECGEGMDEESWADWKSYTEFLQNYQLMQLGLPLEPAAFNEAVDSWKAGVEECGAYEGHGDFVYEAESDGLEVSTEVQFAEREAEVVFAFDKDLYLETLTVNAHFDSGEILSKAGLNTILGMGIVFIVLVLMCFIIYLFRFIPILQEKFGKKSPESTEEAAESEPVSATAIPEEVPVSAGNDDEIIAVISAAIAAAEEDSTVSTEDASGFVVRSIRRRPSNKWNS